MDFFAAFFAILFLVAFFARIFFWRRKFNALYIGVLILISVIFYIWIEQEELVGLFEFADVQPFVLMNNFFLVILLSMAMNYFGGIGLAHIRIQKYRKLLLIILICLNLGVLGFFKYTNFIASNLSYITGGKVMIPLRVDASPLGISYYTFAALSYILDIYFSRMKVQKNPANILLFFCFFPKLIAGPITRASVFIKSLEERDRFTVKTINESLFLFVQGAFLKIVCADNLAPIVNANWSLGISPNAHAMDLILLVVLYAIQLFCDFAGYSQMARGLALALGFRLPVNFLYPFTANSITAFWRNWHISLTEWMRTYLFFPLERLSRKKIWLTITPVIVMFITGLWHGGNWTFIVWGFIHGLGMAIERALGLNRGDVKPVPRFLWTIIAQMIIFIGWVFFRSTDCGSAVVFFQNILHGFSYPELRGFSDGFLVSVFPMISFWRQIPGATTFDGILPILLDLLPILTVVIIHLYGLSSQEKEMPAISPLATAVITGVMLFLVLSAAPLTIGKTLYGNF